MGGCCCSSRKPQLLHGTPVYYYFPTMVLEEDNEFQSANTSPDMVLTRRLHPFDLNLDMSTPDTYRTPPAPIPYDALFGCGSSSDSESLRETISCSSFETIISTALDLKEAETSSMESPRKSKVEPLKPDEFVDNLVTEEEDVCPICLEEYIEEDPKILTRCKHHFHLECILEWMERSDVCPICNQETELEDLNC
ncbi:probable E3 ubiquitin-protein ligase RHB1A [Impatiens glandulifera]|uniref:probable E3 ubiquitin-protein ligase RHB1A n=1 Tax=Impatiens glandulifera TaxID=253017 RepID=UPI001FB0FC91|nr:probable E3 ubiquitin-protein ligase RHB1A [Impatiens glandulifera]